MNRGCAVVTGGTGGLGLELARGLLKTGMDVVIVGRRTDKGKRALADLRHDPRDMGTVAFEQADLSVQAEVRDLAGRISAGSRALDLLINNAGAYYGQHELTADGVERTMANNHFGAFLLTALLLPQLGQAPQARIVNTASSIYRMARLDLADINFERRFSGTRAYAASKLANILFTRALAQRLPAPITANAFNPGSVRSDFNRYLKMPILRWLTIAPEVAARSALPLAVAPELKAVTGAYFDRRGRQEKLIGQAASDTAADALWDLSETMTGSPWRKALGSSRQAA